MITHLNVNNHKALVRKQKIELGHINVICGKNNSGKTTVLEALCNSDCYSIGKELDDADWLAGLFKNQADRYSNPHPVDSMTWFKDYMNSLIQEKVVWFSDDIENITNKIRESQKKHSELRTYSEDIFKFDGLFQNFFKKSVEFFNPALIPPKRQLEFESPINLTQEITPAGSGIINKIFFLKNQDLDSADYKVYKKIYDTFYDITDSKFNVIPGKDNKIKLVYNTNGNWVSASACGLGLSDVLIIVSIFNILQRNVFLLEEPENHLHADYQKKLLKYLKSLRSKQFFITTHSSVFLDTNVVDKIIYCTNNGEITLSDQTSKSEIINSLGYSITENLVADLVILLEGPTDIPVIREMLNWLGINSTYNIKFWPLGGDIMASLDLSIFAERNNVFALIDSDPKSSVIRTRFAKNCDENGVYCKKLTRYSIENYFPLDAIRKAFPEIPADLKAITPMKPVDVQVGFKEQGKTIKLKNAQIVQNMTISDIDGTDLHIFLNDVKEFLIK